MVKLNQTGWLAAVLLFLTVAAGAVRAEVPFTNSPWSRIVMIGASASAGFTLIEPLGGARTAQCRLSHYVDAALAAPHEPVRNLANPMFFMNPEGSGRTQAVQAVQERPSLVLAVDFLFWFCYGHARSEAERLQRVERALKLLEPFSCPLVLGDIPDASYATNTGIIVPAQVPAAETREAANRRLREWAAARPQVAIMPLSDFMRIAMANQAFSLRGQVVVPAGQTRELLQLDQLHPRPQGAAALALGLLDAYLSKHAETPGTEVRWDPALVLKAGGEFARASPTNEVKQAAPAAGK
jgi:hypothetical protein